MDVEGVRSLEELQEAVADACAEMEEDELDELVMQFEDAEGETVTVTNLIPFECVQRARQLRLVPRARAGASWGTRALPTPGSMPPSSVRVAAQLDDDLGPALNSRPALLGARWPGGAQKGNKDETRRLNSRDAADDAVSTLD